MEKARLSKEELPSGKATGDVVTAETILSPRLLRFGNQHALREAVWLMSEMLKRADTKSATSLFLQNKDGKLDGELNIWAMLKILAKELPDTEETISNEALAKSLKRHFGESISEVCRKDMPKLTPDTELHLLTQTATREDLSVLPVCDEDGRLTGLVRSVDLLKGIGMSIGFNPEKELPKA